MGHVGQGFPAPIGKVFGRNSWTPLVPLMPRYVAVSNKEPGRSRCTDKFQFCAYPGRKLGSTAKVLGVVEGQVLNPFASVSGQAGLFWTLKLFESGACCAICKAIV